MRYHFALVLALLAAACDSSTVRVRGRVFGADGRPAVGYYVGLSGLDVATDERFRRARTGADGRYEIVAELGETPDEWYRMVVIIYSDNNNSTAHISLPEKDGDFILPDVHVWNDALATTPLPEGGSRVSWTALPGAAEASYVLNVIQSNSGNYGPTTWVTHVSSTSYDLVPEVTEDRYASIDVTHTECSGELCVFQTSAPITQPTGTLVPLSRGASCSSGRSGEVDAPVLDTDGGPCPLTNGSVEYNRLSDCNPRGCSSPDHLVVDLGTPTAIRMIVLHNLSLVDRGASAEIQVSTDGVTFTPVQTLGPVSYETYALVPLDPPLMARLVRVVASEGGIADLNELSVF